MPAYARPAATAIALLTLVLVGCGSEEPAETTVTVSAQVEELIAALRASADPATHAEFDAAQACLRETFASYADAELQTLIDGVRAQDFASTPPDLRDRLLDDAAGCNEENRTLDPADYQEDTEARIAADGRTNVQCDLPPSTAVGTTFRCTGNFQNRTSEYLATIGPDGRVDIKRTDEN